MRIIASFMHETERDAATSLFNNQPEETESYLIGDADEHQIQAIREQGLIVEKVPEAIPLLDANRVFERENNFVRGGVITNFLPVDDVVQMEGFYKIFITGPLLEVNKLQLSDLKVNVIEFFPPSAFTAKLDLQQVRSVRNLSFVSNVQVFSTPTTKSVATNLGFGPPLSANIKTFDLRLHTGEDIEAVTNLLTVHNILVVRASDKKLRIQMLEDDDLITEIASYNAISGIEEFVPPQLFNDVARQLLHIENTHPLPAIGLLNILETGTGQIIGVADTGIDDTHPDFNGRITGIVALGRPGVHSDPHGHGTHVAGSVLGDGNASGGAIKGTAPNAQLFFQSLLDSSGGLGGLPIELSMLFEEAYLNGARIHNNSWGANAQSRYTFNSLEVDEYVDQRRDMLVVIAAGNEGDASILNTRVAPGFTDWLSIGAPATAKNALTVGASRSNRIAGGLSTNTYGNTWSGTFPSPPTSTENVSGDPTSIAEFSSRGPSDDERIKPDLVAPGTDILSTKSNLAPLRNFWGPSNTGRYAYMGGTSMAAPLVSGCAALVREYYVSSRNHQEPSAALLKATLINGTQMLTGRSAVAEHAVLPNFHQGFGAVDMVKTIPNVAQTFDLQFIDSWQDPSQQITRTGQRFRYAFDLPNTDWLRICLAYTDAPGRALQNDLNITLQYLPSVGVSQKWTGNQGAVANQLLQTPDRKNNVETIRLFDALPGRYIIQVSAYNFFKGNFQDFALVVSAPIINNFTQI